jgi:hypothetical protein
MSLPDLSDVRIVGSSGLYSKYGSTTKPDRNIELASSRVTFMLLYSHFNFIS